MVLVTPGNQLCQWKALRPTETAAQVLFSPAVTVYKLEPALTSSLLPLPSPREGGGQGATTLRKSLCCRAQPLNSVTFREPHIYFKDLLFALESSSQIPSLHPLNSNTHCWELRVSCREDWTWTLHQVAWILGVMVTEARMKHVPSTASSVSDVQWITVASRVHWQCWAGGEGCVRRITAFFLLFNLHPLPSPFLWSSLSCQAAPGAE